MGSVDKVSQKSRYLEQPVNKLVVLVENKDRIDDSISRPEAGTCFQDGHIFRGAIYRGLWTF